MKPRITLSDFTGDGQFGPLTSLTNASDLRCGSFSLREKLELRFRPKGAIANCIDPVSPLAEVTIPQTSTPSLQSDVFISSRTLLSGTATEAIVKSTRDERYLTLDGRLIGYRRAAHSKFSLEEINHLPVVNLDANRIDFPWHLDKMNGQEIATDLELIESLDKGVTATIPADVKVRGAENIYVTGEVHLGVGALIDAVRHHVRLEKNCRLGAGAILSAEEGPIWLAEGAEIEPGAIIQGPVFIGAGSIVRAGARLNGAVSLGKQCRVGGELSNVIMMGYSNKQHSGYLGGAVLGQWVNLGAATDNSDLKNNYHTIDVTLYKEKIDSGDLHIGVFLGDFVRTAIQSRLNSGTVIGTCCNLFGNDFPEKAVPPFIWFGSDGYQEYRLDKALETIRMIVSRRKQEVSTQLEEALSKLFDETRDWRRNFLKQI